MRLPILLVVLFAGVAFAQPPASVSFSQVQLTLAGTALHLQVASTPPAREQGLMHRTTLAPWDGMLFVFDEPQPVAFWMKNTSLPLQVGYFDATGVLREIYPLQPFDTTPIPSQRHDILYALELPAGNFERYGIKIGSQLPLDTLKSVLK